MARNNTISYLSSKYYDSELKLDKAARHGDLKAVDRAMKEHHDYEYALLCKKAKKY